MQQDVVRQHHKLLKETNIILFNTGKQIIGYIIYYCSSSSAVVVLYTIYRVIDDNRLTFKSNTAHHYSCINSLLPKFDFWHIRLLARFNFWYTMVGFRVHFSYTPSYCLYWCALECIFNTCLFDSYIMTHTTHDQKKKQGTFTYLGTRHSIASAVVWTCL